MTDRPHDERVHSLLAVALFGAIGITIGIDLWEDFGEGTRVQHVVIEATVMGLAILGAAAFAHRLRRAAQSLRTEADRLRQRTLDLADDLERRHAEAQHWRSEAEQLLRGLGAAIDQQFERWKLSTAEKDVGLLLLKGLSHGEIANIRRVSERTVRQQSRAIYRKAGLGGRADLAAYFLEDLLLPPEAGANLNPPKSPPRRGPDRLDEARLDRRT